MRLITAIALVNNEFVLHPPRLPAVPSTPFGSACSFLVAATATCILRRSSNRQCPSSCTWSIWNPILTTRSQFEAFRRREGSRVVDCSDEDIEPLRRRKNSLHTPVCKQQDGATPLSLQNSNIYGAHRTPKLSISTSDGADGRRSANFGLQTLTPLL